MSRIDAAFAALRRRGSKALIPYVCAGDPHVDTTAAIMRAMAGAGADVIELAPTLPKDHLMVVNLSGRGDKDVPQVAEILGSRM